MNNDMLNKMKKAKDLASGMPNFEKMMATMNVGRDSQLFNPITGQQIIATEIRSIPVNTLCQYGLISVEPFLKRNIMET